MGSQKRNLLAGQAGGAKERHKRTAKSQYDHSAPVPEGFVAKPAIPKSKHHSYFEFVENKNKKKKLESQDTTNKTPPPGFEFVPIGNPELTTACKELSREKDAMIFIVSNSIKTDPNFLASQVHRVGHHVRETIVDEARASIGQALDPIAPAADGPPEPIPKSQEEYNVQVDAAIRDLFPRIPNTDRQMIIEHAFRMGTTFKGDKPVGLSGDITLARRVQLAVLAHIRHNHTRYDSLLKETTWQNARKVVESLCLDTLVKWRGDEETGRDQLDEILREVVVISDSEDDDSDEESDDGSVEEVEPPRATAFVRVEGPPTGDVSPRRQRSRPANAHHELQGPSARAKGKANKRKKRKTAAEKKGQRGFKRYHAWQEAIRRFREEPGSDEHPSPMDRPPNPNYAQHEPTHHPTIPFPANQLLDISDPRIAASGAGPAPAANGYVAQASSHDRQPVNIPQRSYSPLPRARVHDKVMSPRVIPSDSPVSYRPVPMVANRFQDLLVPSIEPPSPGAMAPSFVRAVPPRGQDFGNSSPISSHVQSSPRRFSQPRGAIVRDEPVVVARRVAHRERLAPLSAYDDPGYISGVQRGQEYMSVQSEHHMSNSPIHRPVRQSFDADHNIYMASPQAPRQEVGRPVDRPRDTILMEDRGGFFERVSAHPDGAHPLPQTTRVVEFRQPAQVIRRMPEPHRIVSLQEQPRIIRESRSSSGLSTVPVTRSLPSGLESRVLAESAIIRSRTPDEVFYRREPSRQFHPMFDQPSRPEVLSRSGDRVAYREDQHMEMRVPERIPIAHPLDQSIQRAYDNDVHMQDAQRTPRRGFPLHPHRPEDVIVIE